MEKKHEKTFDILYMALLTCVNLISWFAFHPKGAAVAVMQLTVR